MVEGQDGYDALEQAQNENPDLILMDVMMPKITGYETCEKLKANPDTCEIPVIFITALHQLQDVVRGFDLGAVDFVTKPFMIPELISRVNLHLDLRSTRLKLESVNEQLAERNSELAYQNHALTESHRRNEKLQSMIQKLLPGDIWEQAKANVEKGFFGLKEAKVTRTYLFLDLIGFTAFGEGNKAKTVVESLNQVLEPATKKIRSYGGYVNKFLGDSIFAVFQNPQKAVDFAVEFQSSLVDAGDSAFKARIGISFGKAVRCNVGSEERSEHTYIGVAVNLAARLESACPPGQIVLSRQLFEALARSPENCHEIRVQLKGIDGEQIAYLVKPVAKAQ